MLELPLSWFVNILWNLAMNNYSENFEIVGPYLQNLRRLKVSKNGYKCNFFLIFAKKILFGGVLSV